MAKRRKHEMHEEHIDETWLIPYADLLTLLLALFIVLFAASNVDKEKYAAMAKSFHSEFVYGGIAYYIDSGIGPESPTPSPMDSDTISEDEDAQNLAQMQAELEQYLMENGLDADVKTSIDERGLVISMKNAALFDSASAMIRPDYTGILVKIGETINRLDNYIRIEGHTDNVPIDNAEFRSNWELSNARATNVLHLFINEAHVAPQRLGAIGYGEFRPIESNDTAEGRDKNRRVDIILISKQFNILEQQPKI